MNKDTIPLKAILFVLLLAMLWGGNAVALKIGFLEFMPLASAGLRFSTAALLIIVWAYPNRISLWPEPHERFSLLLLGLLFALQIICFNLGTDLTRAGRSAVMINYYLSDLSQIFNSDDMFIFWPAVSEITGEKTKFVSPEKKLFENEKVTVLSLRTNGNIQVSSQKTGPYARKLSG